MEDIQISDVLKATGGRLGKSEDGSQKTEVRIKGVSIDSRAIKSDELFVAIKGNKSDGHSFIIDAVKRGAVCAMVSQLPITDYPLPIIVVEDTLKALGDLASWYRGKFSIPIIGVTGSNGKTTTKELIVKCLSIKYRVCKSESSFNSLTGVPISIFNLSSTHEVGVFEVGTNQMGEMARLANIVSPKFAVITNIGPTHLESFKTIEGVLDEKLNLVRAAEIAILNADDPWLAQVQIKAFRYGIECGNLRAEILDSMNGTKFKARDVIFTLPLYGRYQVYNTLAALSIGLQFGLGLDEMSEVIKTVNPSTHRDEIIWVDAGPLTRNTIKIIDSTYNANPMSMELAIRELSNHKNMRRVAILGDMFELGDNALDFHTKIGKLLKELNIDIVIGYGELAKGYIEGKLQSSNAKIQSSPPGADQPPAENEIQMPEDNGSGSCNKFYFSDLTLLINELESIIKSGDVILVKGSRAMGMERIVESLKLKVKS
ncbi:MAG: UDP-N-acetylmuramoyl-tripeptide--D-alanyl-D-alanine ligase [Candidatus Stahlbacteria bacterium]|nr:UDP-N-acetylmuramoyl-tripeptide--D-alanyl-D-alanine ligase [Candidatus Stahlbacteria bacterium]